MSYILDALKKSDRSRQLNSTHTMQLQDQKLKVSRNWKWPLFASGLIAVLAILFFVFKQSDLKDKSDVVIGGEGDFKVERLDEALDPDPLENDIAVISLNEVAQGQEGKQYVETTPQFRANELQKDEAQDIISVNDTKQPAKILQKERRSLQSLLSEKKVVSENIDQERSSQATTQSVMQDMNSLAASNNQAQFEEALSQSEYTNYRSLRSSLSGLEEMHLDILAYHVNASDRRAYINMKKYIEGDVTAEGSTIREIRSDGVVMSYQGREFILTAK